MSSASPLLACPPPPPDAVPGTNHLARALGSMLTRVPATVLPGSSRRAAVLIALYDIEDTPHLVLTRRPDTLSHHAGQVSLPGGRWETGDWHLRTTALREAEEEIGIAPAEVRVLGRLDDVHARGSDHIIAPFVGTLATPPLLRPDAREIARVMEVPLEDVLRADAVLPAHVDDDVAALRYPLLGEDVWGATARILRRFCRLTRCALAQS